MSKAFDSINHESLIDKLENIGIGGDLRLWITNYLRNLKQYVGLDNVYSDKQKVICGVPQGSVRLSLHCFIYM